MKALRDGASGGITKFFLMGFMVLAVGGLVMTDVGGFFRGGVSGSDVARIGDETIKISQFDRTLRRNLRSIGLSPQDAYKLGYINQILSDEIRASLLKQAGNDHGILVSDARAAAQIQTLIQPMVQAGQDTKDIFQQVLRAQGLGEGEFVQAVKRDIGNNLLLNMFNNNFSVVSDELAGDLYKHENEKRAVRYVTFLDEDTTETPLPTDEQLKALYLSTQETYAREETRILKVITLDTEALRKTLSISKGDIKQYYTEHSDSFDIPASWELDQAIIPQEKKAKEIYKAVRSGALLAEAVEDITSNKSGYLGKSEVLPDDVLEDLKKHIENVEKPGTLLQPIKSPLGWHIIRVEKISAAHKKTLEDVAAQIEKELADTQLIDQLYDLANEMEDLFASGASLEEVAGQIDLVIKTTVPINEFGLSDAGRDILKSYGRNKDQIIESGFTLLEGETSPVFETASGDFSAVNLAALSPKNYRPFEEIKPALAKRWISDQKRQDNKTRVREALNTDKSLKEIAQSFSASVAVKKNIGRNDPVTIPFVPYAVSNIFEAPLHKIIIVEVQGGSALLEVTSFKWPDVDTGSIEYRSFKAGLVNTAKEEALRSYLENQQLKHQATINTRLLNQIYGPESQAY